MKFRRSEKDELYYLHASQIQHKTGMTEIIYEINDDKKLKDTEEEEIKIKRIDNPNFKEKSAPVMNGKEVQKMGASIQRYL